MYESEYINKQEILNAFDEADCDVHEAFADEYCEFGFSRPLVRSIIHELPFVDAVPVVHGRWVYKHRHRGGFRRKTGVDDTGEPHTITVDERYETDDPYCSECGKLNESVWLNYCPNCGAKMEVDHEDD